MIDAVHIEETYGINVYPKRPVTIIRGSGALLWDDQGKEYIDCAAGIGVANVGHAHPRVAKAIARQALTLITCPGIFYNDKRAELIQKLIAITPEPLRQVFLCNSGTESLEAALKFARLTTGKSDFVCAMRSYHGRTMGALSATFKKEYKEGVGPLVPGFSFAPFGNNERFEKLVTDKTAAIVLEVVQGEGGVNMSEASFFEQIQKLCRKRNILLIIDEVQTGFGRTGKLFAIEHFGIEPDILCLAKAIAGGVPMGAVVCNKKITVPSGKHGTTFGGNPLACAAACAAIDVIVKENLSARSLKLGAYFVENFPAITLDKVRQVRQIGLMIGIEMKEAVKDFILALMDQGVLALPAGRTVLRLLPPLTISKDQLDKVITALVNVLA